MSVYCRSGEIQKVLYALSDLIPELHQEGIIFVIPFYRWGLLFRLFEMNNCNGVKASSWARRKHFLILQNILPPRTFLLPIFVQMCSVISICTVLYSAVFVYCSHKNLISSIIPFSRNDCIHLIAVV